MRENWYNIFKKGGDKKQNELTSNNKKYNKK